VTLNDLERRNGRVVCVISPNSVAFVDNYVKVVDCHQQIFSREMLPTKHDGRAVLFAVAELLVTIERRSACGHGGTRGTNTPLQ